MKCVNPFVTVKAAYGCGQCMPCRFNKQRLWYHRILLEAMCHKESSFVTLTIAPDCELDDGSVHGRDLQLWIKRFRKACGDCSIRHFSVGEYGDKTGRPHYHSVIFGRGCSRGPVRECRTPEGWSYWRCECQLCSDVRKTWTYGHVSVSPLTWERARYIAKYTLKRMTQPSDFRLEGRAPEFARMSRRPYGIGAGVIPTVALNVSHLPAVPAGLSYGKKVLPLGRYLRARLAKETGLEITQAPDAQLSAVRAFAFSRKRSVQSVYKEVFSELEASLQNKVRLQREKVQI